MKSTQNKTVVKASVESSKETQKLANESKLLSELTEARRVEKQKRDAYIASLPQATVEDVSGIVSGIRNQERASTSVPRLVKLDNEVEKRIDKATPAYTAIETAIENRQKILKSKKGRARVDETLKGMKCVSFVLRTKKTSKGVKASANAVFAS